MTLQPATVEQIQQVVRDEPRVCARGGGTKSTPPDDTAVIHLTRLSGITEYSPAECVFTALAGTPLSEIETALGAQGQYMPFDPPFAADGATIGGTVASGLSGPGRYRYGGVRDFLIGVRVVDGEGHLIRSGGQVVKNAAGFLLHHGMVGSLGRFGVLTELTFKVFPRPAARRTITVECGSVAGAFAAARQVEDRRCDCAAIDFNERGTLWVQLAGSRAAIDARALSLAEQARRLTLDAAVRVYDSSPDTSYLGHDSSPDTNLGHDSSPDPSVGHDSSPDPGSRACVKVAGLMNTWQELTAHVTCAHFMCAGSVAWLFTNRLNELAEALRAAQLTGLVIRGPHAGERVGHLVHNEFEERVRRVLDPHNKFRAASNPRR